MDESDIAEAHILAIDVAMIVVGTLRNEDGVILN
jgi:hypothetical protein